MAVKRTIFDQPHHQSLELLATQALADGNISRAFKFADRRCRILPLPEPHCYVLRSEALFRMGAREIAISDLAKALEIAPDDLGANRRMLAWARGQQQKHAARTLIGRERNFDVLRKAIHILMEDGQRNFANVIVTEETIEGWALWQENSPLTISISNETHPESEICEPDSRHPLGDCGHAASFGQAAHDRNVGLQDIGRALLDDVAEREARRFALAGADGHRDPTADFGQPGQIVVGQYRLLEPGDIQVGHRIGQPHGAVDAQRAVRVHHQFDVRAERLARQPQPFDRPRWEVRLIQTADADLDSAEAFGAIAEHFVNRLLRRGPAAAGVGWQAVAHATAEQAIDR